MSLEIFQQLAEPIDPARIKERKQGGATIRYIDARAVIDRLNSVCPGQWTFETELLSMPQAKGDKWVFKGRLTVCGAWQEDVGMNDNEDYFDPPKSAVSDALKRCAVHFGIGTELYGDAPKQNKSNGNSKHEPEQPKPASKWPPRPWAPETLKAAILASVADKPTDLVNPARAQKVSIVWKNITGQNDKVRHSAVSYLVGVKVNSFKELSGVAVEALNDWLTKNSALARQEAKSVAELLATAAPQQSMLEQAFPRDEEAA